MEQPESDRLVTPAVLTPSGDPPHGGQLASTVDEWLDLLRISRAVLLRRSPSEIAAITVSGQLRDAGDARRLLMGCARAAEEYDLREQVHLEGGYFSVRMSRG